MTLLIKPECFRQYVKNMDLYFFIPVGAISQWPTSMYEGITIGVYLPFLIHNPWELSNVPFMGKMVRTLSAMYGTDAERAGHPLRKIWSACTWIATMPQSMVHRLLLSETWHKLLGMYRK